MIWRLGTMGFSYKDWEGVFYPKGLKSSDWLSFYAKHFNAVELDTTFHAIPRAEYVEKWRDETPDDFRFAVKTPHGITHDQTIDRATGPMREFLNVMGLLGTKLAVVLLQFPPSFASDEFDRLARFLAWLPRDMRFAVELRHASWFTRQTATMLRERDVALVSADYVNEPRQLTVTTDFLYLRWIGQHQQFGSMDHEQIDVTARLLWWRDQILAAAPRAQTVFGFFNNDYAGYSVATCNKFKRLIGEPVIEVEDRRQGRLF